MSTYQIQPLIGRIFASVEREEEDRLLLKDAAGQTDCLFFYEPDCCASCYIEDVAGDLSDLVGSPIIMAEFSSSDQPPSDTKIVAQCPQQFRHDWKSRCPACEAWFNAEHGMDDSNTWTFVKLATQKGYVTIRWYGSSNGYYCERPSFEDCAAARQAESDYRASHPGSVDTSLFTPWPLHIRTLDDEEIDFTAGASTEG